MALSSLSYVGFMMAPFFFLGLACMKLPATPLFFFPPLETAPDVMLCRNLLRSGNLLLNELLSSLPFISPSPGFRNCIACARVLTFL